MTRLIILYRRPVRFMDQINRKFLNPYFFMANVNAMLTKFISDHISILYSIIFEISKRLGIQYTSACSLQDSYGLCDYRTVRILHVIPLSAYSDFSVSALILICSHDQKLAEFCLILLYQIPLSLLISLVFAFAFTFAIVS